MKEDQRERIIKRHKHSIWMHGHSPLALYWENREVQELRFEVLVGCGVKTGDSVLDIGCGFADLYHYMQSKGIEVDYTGIDLSPDMIEAAKSKAPTLKLFQGDLLSFNPPKQSYDWGLLSGALNEPLHDDGEYLHAMLPRLYATCRKGIAFNLLNDEYEWTEQERYTLQAYKPTDIMAQLNALSQFTMLRKDYLEVDASYFVWRDKQFQPRKSR